eukprot:1911346-Amphidinium_carterae.1
MQLPGISVLAALMLEGKVAKELHEKRKFFKLWMRIGQDVPDLIIAAIDMAMFDFSTANLLDLTVSIVESLVASPVSYHQSIVAPAGSNGELCFSRCGLSVSCCNLLRESIVAHPHTRARSGQSRLSAGQPCGYRYAPVPFEPKLLRFRGMLSVRSAVLTPQTFRFSGQPLGYSSLFACDAHLVGYKLANHVDTIRTKYA